MSVYPFLGGGFPYYNRLQKKVGTLILASLLEKVDKAVDRMPRFIGLKKPVSSFVLLFDRQQVAADEKV